MSPEHRDECNIVWFWDDELGINKSANWSGAHFVEPKDYKRVRLVWEGSWDNGRLGTWVGWDEEIRYTCLEGGNFPRFEKVVWDGEHGVTSLHGSHVIFLGGRDDKVKRK